MKYTEVRNNYNNDEGYWTVDAWENPDDNATGKVVAVVNDKTAEVYYIEPYARFSPLVTEAVEELKKRVEATMTKLYVASVTELDTGTVVSVTSFSALAPQDLAGKVIGFLREYNREADGTEAEIRFDPQDIISECVNAKPTGTVAEPLSIEMVDDDRECLLHVALVTAFVPEQKKGVPAKAKDADVPAGPDIVEVICYGRRERLPRKDAIRKYFAALAASEGAEHERYENIVYQLANGAEKASDSIDWRDTAIFGSW